MESGTWVGQNKGGAETMAVRKCLLEVIEGPDKGRSDIVASSTIVIGRGGGDFVLTDRKVSALHAEVRLEASGYRLRDLGSTNGTFVRNMRVVEALIEPGTIIGLGDSAVRFTPLADTIELPLWSEASLCSLVGRSPVMRRLFEAIDRIAASDTTVLLTGETGTGKDLAAEAIHERSPRAGRPFVVLDCGAIPAQLFEDQLFGHEAGAFTGASRAFEGVFEAAHGGTLLLDEIGDLPLEIQPKLLRAVETRRIRRIGGTRTVSCDVRVVAATNRDLPAEVNRRAFRSDLYFRIMVAHLHLPPLRERREDIEILIHHFLQTLSAGRQRPTLPDGFLDWALNYTWPGNVRELRNAVERAVITRSIPETPGAAVASPEDAGRPAVDLNVPFKEAKRRVVDEFDRDYLLALLEAHDWNIASAARAADLDRMSIYKMLQRLGIRRSGEGS
jgi:two-component system response regulator GlrR